MNTEEHEIYGVVKYTTTPFDNDMDLGHSDVYGVLVGETSIRAFRAQRPIVNYSIEVCDEEYYFQEYGNVDMGSKLEDTICHDIIIFPHEDIELQQHIESILGEYHNSIDLAVKLSTSYLNVDRSTENIIIKGLYDAKLSVINLTTNIREFRPECFIEEYMMRVFHYDSTWRTRKW